MANPWGRLEDGIGQGLRFEPAGYNGGQPNSPTTVLRMLGDENDATTVSIELVGGGSDSWLLTIYAEIGRGVSMLGRIRTLPWSQGARTAAICAHPGARAWEIRGRRIPPVGVWVLSGGGTQEIQRAGDPPGLSRTDGARILGVNVSCTPKVGGVWGITPIRGFAERAVDSLYMTGIDGNILVRGNVLGWTALNTLAVDGFVQVNAGANIIVPANGGFVQGGQNVYKGYAQSFNFFGTSEYRVDYERENPFEGAGELP